MARTVYTEKYKLNDVEDMIRLAHKVQVEFYWRSTFYIEIDGEEKSVPYRYFWDYAQSAYSENGCTLVEITGDTVVFKRCES